MLPAAYDVDRALADVAWLVEEVGPRADGSPAAVAAAKGVAERLRDAGWSPQGVGRPDNLVACRGDGRTLVLAHTDTVAGSPGAVDNAAGVATLLELARTSAAADLCLAFPVAEERGLLGSTAMAAQMPSWHPGDGPSLVISLDLVGQGDLAAMGLGAQWGDTRLDWALEAWRGDAPELPFAHRIYSRMAPTWERSDHAPFAQRGLPAMLLFGRGEGHVFSRYHQPSDRTVEPQAMRDVAAAIEALATAPTPIPAPEPAGSALAIGARLVPTRVTGSVLLGGLFAGFLQRSRWRELPGMLWRGAALTLAAGLVTGGVLAIGWFGPTEAEETARAVTGAAATGWWAAAPWAVISGALVALFIRRALQPRGPAAIGAALFILPALWLDPLLALPFAAAAILAHLHPLFAAAPALYLLQPDVLRELAFQGLVPPAALALAWLLAWPAAGGYPSTPPAPSEPA